MGLEKCPKPVEDWPMPGSSTMFITVAVQRDEARISGMNGSLTRLRGLFEVCDPFSAGLATAVHPRKWQFLQDEIASGYV